MSERLVKEQAAEVQQESRSPEFMWLALTKDRMGYVTGMTAPSVEDARRSLSYYLGNTTCEHVAVVRVDLSRVLWEQP